jgi:hypothetical protein
MALPFRRYVPKGLEATPQAQPRRRINAYRFPGLSNLLIFNLQG